MAPPRSRGVIALAVLALLCGAARGSPVRKLLQGDIAGDSLPNKRVANDDVHGDDHKNNFNPVDNSGAAQLFIRKESDLPGGDFDLQYSSIVFQAGGGACRAPASQLAVDPTGGALLELNSDDTTEIEFDDGFEFPFFGKNYDSAFVASNGFVTFGEDDDEFRPTMDRHFDGPPRISGLWTDLATGLNGTYSWKQVNAEAGPWSAVAVTFHDLISTDHKAVRNTFQIAMMANGDVLLSFLDANPHHDALVGIAPGRTGESSADASSSSSFPPWDNGKWEQAEDEEAGPPSYQQTNLSNLPACGLGTAAVLGMWANRGTDEVAAPGGEAEIFLADEDRTSTFDLAFTTLTFPADGSSWAPACRAPASVLPVDPAGGQVLFMDDDDSVKIDFEGGFQFPFFGHNYTAAYVGSNGYITFTTIDTDRRPTAAKHYETPRISAMYSDLRAHRGDVSWKQIGQLAVVVDFIDTPSEGNSDAEPSTFQIIMHASGDVSITYLQAQPTTNAIVGISGGRTTFPLPAEVDFTARGVCDKGAHAEAELKLVAAQASGARQPDDGAAEAWLMVVGDGDDGEEPDDDNHGANVLDNSPAPPFPLAFSTLTFSPANGYSACRAPASALPVDPTGGELLFMASDDSTRIVFLDGFEFPFFGDTHRRAYIGSNGYITFTERDTDYTPSLEDHFQMPRISGLFTDMKLEEGSSISWKQVGNEVFAVTYDKIAATGRRDLTSTFQILMFASGEVQITFLEVQVRRNAIVGLSSGVAFYPLRSADFPAKPMCSAISSFQPAAVDAAAGFEEAPVVGAAELFARGEFDLEGYTLTFGADNYSTCLSELPRDGRRSRLPIDPMRGIALDLGDDDSELIDFPGRFAFPYFGASYRSVHVGSNGYLTFTGGSNDYTADLEDHFKTPRISALFTDLDGRSGKVSWKAVAQEFQAVVITFEDVPVVGDDRKTNTFQIALHSSGEIQLSYLDVGLESDAVVGVSGGKAYYPLSSADLSEAPTCKAED